MSDVPHLLAPTTLGALPLANRVIMAGMSRGRALRDGTPSPHAATYFTQRATAGLMITDGAAPSPQGIGYAGTIGMWTDEQVEAWREVTGAVHAAGGQIALQLLHCGRVSLHAWQEGGAAPVTSTPVPANVMLRSPRGIDEPAAEPRALDISEIPGVVQQFALAARRARVAGFDGVEIHAADGYLIDQFLRDGVNQRFDRYGGAPEHRARFLLEVTEAVAKEIGADRTGVRLSPTGTANDMRDRDPLTTVGTALRLLASLDIAWVHLAGMADTDLTRRLRDAYTKPFILNGDFTAEAADTAIRSELACAVSFGRAFIANPDLVARFSANLPLAVPDAATFFTGGERGYIDYPFYNAADFEPRD